MDMMTILTLGDDLLRVVAKPAEKIDGELGEFIKGLFATMKADRGLGLAAPQVGRSIRVFVTHADKDKDRVFINPQMVRTSEELVDYEEGCMSIPGLYAEVRRPKEVTVQAFNEKGRPFTVEADGLLARVIQHEFDHLEGKLFIDYLSEAKRKKLVEQWEKSMQGQSREA
jgi:peptide deformylase